MERDLICLDEKISEKEFAKENVLQSQTRKHKASGLESDRKPSRFALRKEANSSAK
jgi:hypothetical protein